MPTEDRRDLVLRMRTASDNACMDHAALLLEAADAIELLRTIVGVAAVNPNWFNDLKEQIKSAAVRIQ